MRNTRKIFVALVIVLAMMLSMATLFVSAADQQPAKLYLTPNANWKTDGARSLPTSSVTAKHGLA